MVLLTPTPALTRAIDYLDRLGQLSDLGLADTGESRNLKSRDHISHEQIVKIFQRLQAIAKTESLKSSDDDWQPHLDDLLRGSRIYIEPPKGKPEQTSEYKALMARLRREEEARQYELMTRGPPGADISSQRLPNAQRPNLFPTQATDVEEDEEVAFADINRQMTLIANILVSIVACSVAIWMAAKHWSTPSRLGLSMGGSGLVGFAEAAVYLGYIRRVKVAREKGQKEVEVKEIIRTWISGEDKRKTTEPTPIPSASSDSKVIQRRKLPSE